MSQLPKIYLILFSFLIAIIPFTEHIQAIPNIVLGILAVLFPFVVKKGDWQGLNTRTNYTYLSLIFFVLVGILVRGSWEDFGFLNKILIVPVLVILSIPIKDFKKPLYAFLIGSGSLLLISVLNIIWHFLTYHTFKMDVGGEVNKILMGERPYLGFIYLLSFCVSIYLLKFEKNKWVKKILYLSTFVYCLFIILISARLSILSLAIILGVFFFYTKNKKRAFFISFGGILLVVIMALVNPNFISRFNAGFESVEMKLDKMIAMEPRSHIWECSASIGKFNNVPWMGYGFRKSIENLSECYRMRTKFENDHHKAYFVKSRFNTHNQFLNFYLSAGIFCLGSFLLFFLFLFKNNYRDYTSFALVLALFLLCCLENILSRQLGAMLFGVVITFLLFFRNNSLLEKK